MTEQPTDRPHWDLADAIRADRLTVDQREALAALVLEVGSLADCRSMGFRQEGDTGLLAAAWLDVLRHYDRLLGRPTT